MPQPIVTVLLEPDPARRRPALFVLGGMVVDRAALAECLAAGHHQRYRFGGRRACADCLQDAIAGGREVGVL